jgi:hypothetical protein
MYVCFNAIANQPGGRNEHLALPVDVSVIINTFPHHFPTNQIIVYWEQVGRSVQSLIVDIRGKFNAAPSVVVNSAGITRDNFLLKMDENSWNAVMNVNLKVLHTFENIDNEISFDLFCILSVVGYISCHTSCSCCYAGWQNSNEQHNKYCLNYWENW